MGSVGKVSANVGHRSGYRAAVVVHVVSLDVPMIALSDLIANKRTSGRPQDLADVVLLEKVAQVGP